MRRREIITGAAALAAFGASPAQASFSGARRALLGGCTAVQPYYGQVGTNCQLPGFGLPGTNQTMNRTRHKAMAAISSVRLVFPNFYLAVTNLETLPASATTLTASIEYPAGTFTQAKFAGATSVTTLNSLIFSDPIAVNIPAGAFFFVRSFWTSAWGIVYASATTGAGGRLCDTANGEAMTYAASGLSDQTLGGTVTNTNGVGDVTYRPTAIIGNTTLPSCFLMGDSRCAGSNDDFSLSASTGQTAKAVGQNFPFINCSAASLKLTTWLPNNANQLALSQFCSHVICSYGINDIVVAGRSAAQLQADLQTASNLFGNKPFFACTLPPETTSSDAWATLGNQTLNGTNAARVTYNDALRAGKSYLSGVFDITSVAESSLDSGKWPVTGAANYATNDGVHESPALNQLIATSNIMGPAQIHF